MPPTLLASISVWTNKNKKKNSIKQFFQLFLVHFLQPQAPSMPATRSLSGGKVWPVICLQQNLLLHGGRDALQSLLKHSSGGAYVEPETALIGLAAKGGAVIQGHLGTID